MKPYAEIDESKFPIIYVRFTGQKSTDENFQAYLDGNKNCYRHQKKLAILFDASKASLPSFKHQKMQADWLKENEDLMREYCLGTAYVISNPAVRMILKGIFALQKQPVPYEIFGRKEDAELWLKSRLEN
ncbi:DUF7793 family protein [Algoriphagus sediminis]|uniref:STAS/SEC14 domain-containing protein n=1 Tax=Algoriphagus sediminis TaxID=3057113 RepID=A0ABT7YFE7_9BACT|nr:STAS/SEC14 domain-containing protein [Algoriphagus sediminis]MDN3205253.1 STAS/SEC14 domain-containing protein [Algoriphagus sediminis]